MRQSVEEVLEHLELDLAAEFEQSVSKVLRTLSDGEVNTLYLMTHTWPNLGDPVGKWTAVLLPLVEEELQLRRDIAVIPQIGPVVAPDLYSKGGGHECPF